MEEDLEALIPTVVASRSCGELFFPAGRRKEVTLYRAAQAKSPAFGPAGPSRHPA